MSGPFLFLLLCITTTVVALVIFTDWHEATRLNLHRENCMAQIGDAPTYRIDPTNVGGAPAPVTEITWAVEGAYLIGTIAPDQMSVILNAVNSGAGELFVSARTKSGVLLSESIVLEAVEAPPIDEEATQLGLKRVA
jgi:hypothetical protein